MGRSAFSGVKMHADLLMQSRASLKCCRLSVCRSLSNTHCSSVTDIAVRSLALLQLVSRMPFTERHTFVGQNQRVKSQSDPDSPAQEGRGGVVLPSQRATEPPRSSSSWPARCDPERTAGRTATGYQLRERESSRFTSDPDVKITYVNVIPNLRCATFQTWSYLCQAGAL